MENKILRTINYIFESIFWCFISMICYKSILFRCLPNKTYETSQNILFAMLALSIICCMFFKKDKSGWSYCVCLSLAYGLYTSLAYWNMFHNTITYILVFAGIVSVVTSLFVMTKKIRKHHKKIRVLINRTCKCAMNTWNFFGLAMAVIMILIALQVVFEVRILNMKATKGVDEKQTILSNIEIVKNLQERNWKDLDSGEKLKVIQVIANIESSYLGLSNELNVSTKNLSDGTLASYYDRSHIIYIDYDHLENDSPESVLQSVCHEAYHSFQYRLCDAYFETSDENKKLRSYDNKKAKIYIEELNSYKSYVDGEDNFDEYYGQQCEIDARSYAENAVDDYYSKIREYLGENSDSDLNL